MTGHFHVCWTSLRFKFCAGHGCFSRGRRGYLSSPRRHVSVYGMLMSARTRWCGVLPTTAAFLVALASATATSHQSGAPPGDVGLRDTPIAGTGPAMPLDGSWAWTASSQSLGVAVPATVPGDLLTDLQRSKVSAPEALEMN